MEHQPALPGFDAPPVVAITLRVGLVVAEDHGQWQLEVRNPVSDELLAMESCPHFGFDKLGPQASRMTLRLVEAMRRAIVVGEAGATPPSSS